MSLLSTVLCCLACCDEAFPVMSSNTQNQTNVFIIENHVDLKYLRHDSVNLAMPLIYSYAVIVSLSLLIHNPSDSLRSCRRDSQSSLLFPCTTSHCRLSLMDEPPPSPSLISFRYTWTVRVNERQLSDEESVSLFFVFVFLTAKNLVRISNKIIISMQF